MQNPLLHQNLNHRISDSSDIHCIPRNKMNNFFLDLCWTSWICTIVVDINITNRSITSWAKKWRTDKILSSIPPFFNHSHNIRDDLSTPLHPDKISLFDLLILNKIKIMQTYPRNLNSRELNWLNISNWRDNPSSPHLKIYALNLTSYLLSWEFIGNSSPRMMLCST